MNTEGSRAEAALQKLKELFVVFGCAGEAEVCEWSNTYFLLITDLRGSEDLFCASMPDEIDEFPVYFSNEFKAKFIGEEVS